MTVGVFSLWLRFLEGTSMRLIDRALLLILRNSDAHKLSTTAFFLDRFLTSEMLDGVCTHSLEVQSCKIVERWRNIVVQGHIHRCHPSAPTAEMSVSHAHRVLERRWDKMVEGRARNPTTSLAPTRISLRKRAKTFRTFPFCLLSIRRKVAHRPGIDLWSSTAYDFAVAASP
jgi:hypothetical protein